MNSKAVRILHIFGGLFHGGAEALVMNYYRNLDTAVIQFDFVVHTPETGVYEQEIQRRGGQIYRAPVYKGFNHHLYRKWWKTFLDEHLEYNILHFHIRGSSAIAIPLAKKANRISIIHSHSISNGKSLTSAIKFLFQSSLRRNADYLFACSEAAGKWLYGEQAAKEDRIQIWKNAIELTSYQFQPLIRDTYRQNINAENAFIVGHVGRFIDTKNHRFILEVFKEIKEQRPNALLLLVGDGPLFEPIQKYARALGIEEAVQFLGSRDDVPQLLQAMDVFLFPSKFEGLGIVAIEAQATSLPCVASTAVPKDIQITSLVQMIDLSEGEKYWTKQVLQIPDSRSQEPQVQEALREAGYDIVQATKQLVQFYFTVIGKE